MYIFVIDLGKSVWSNGMKWENCPAGQINVTLLGLHLLGDTVAFLCCFFSFSFCVTYYLKTMFLFCLRPPGYMYIE